MIVCHCLAVNDRRIRELAQHGIASVPDITDACGAGRDCGSCVNSIERVLAASRESDVAIAV